MPGLDPGSIARAMHEEPGTPVAAVANVIIMHVTEKHGDEGVDLHFMVPLPTSPAPLA